MKNIPLFIVLLVGLLKISIAQAIEPPKSSGVRIISASYTLDTGQTLSQLETAHWQARKSWLLPEEQKNVWLKMTFVLEQPQSNGLFISTLSSQEVYWDSVFIGRSGKIGFSAQEEIPGLIDTAYRIPDQLLTLGQHQLIIRLSRHHLPSLGSHNVIDVAIAPHDIIQQQQMLKAYLPFFALGALIVVAIFFFSLSISITNNHSYLAFAVLCLLVAALLLVESWRPLWSYPYDWHLTRLLIVALLTIAISTVLPFVMLKEFEVDNIGRKITVCLVFYFTIVFTIPSFDLSAFIIVTTALCFSLFIIITACHKQKTKATFLISSISLCLLCAFLLPDFLESWFFLLFGVVMVATLHRLANTMRAIKQSAHQKELVNEQLKLELVKAHIQPHFLMNTLTSLAEWIEEAPQVAQELIEALADEFRLLITIVDKDAISLEEELKLCKLHAKVMSLRQDKSINLVIKNTQSQLTIPPGIIHTLIENAISHTQMLEAETLSITIDISEKHNQIAINVIAPLASNKNQNVIGLGTGKRYIEARLQQAYKNNYSLEEWSENHLWHSKIEIKGVA
ncbi:sensor histidine kinase [Thalassotalea ganghwensis]